MDSLAPNCTPFKQRYDSCFNAWFEGYLQPALDAITPRHPGPPVSHHEATLHATSNAQDTVVGVDSRPETVQLPSRTSWAHSIGRRVRPTEVTATSSANIASLDPAGAVQVRPSPPGTQSRYIDPKGKTRAQIKAEEYDVRCGIYWKEYRACLSTAIDANEGLKTLLDAAREEHELQDMRGLAGTPWDPAANIDGQR